LLLRYCSKNGNCMLSRKYSEVFDANVTFPSLSPSPQAQPPCTQGPSTRAFTVAGLYSATDRKILRGPCTSSASNHPPTVITAHFTLRMCAAMLRDFQ